MSHRRLTLAGLLAAVGLAALPVAAQGPAPVAERQKTATPAVSRTPWGHPDLQGVWANNNATPLERPKEIADKAFLTDQEVVSLKAEAARLFDGAGDAAFGDAVFLLIVKTELNSVVAVGFDGLGLNDAVRPGQYDGDGNQHAASVIDACLAEFFS